MNNLQPVLNGFLMAIGIIIAATMMKYLFHFSFC